MRKTIGQIVLNLIVISLAETAIRKGIRLIRGEWGRRPR